MKKTKPRSRSKIAEAERYLQQVIAGENIEDLYAAMSVKERELFKRVVEDIRLTGSSVEVEQLWKVDYYRKPPTIHEFIDDPYFLGATLLPTEDNPGIFPPWREVLQRDFDLDSRIHNLVITGSLGIGKTYIMCAIFLYKLAVTTMMRNPQNLLGLSKGSHIIYAVLSITRAVVAQTAFGDVMNFMANSPYFTEELKYDPGKKYTGQEINLGRRIMLTAGSKGWHVLGRNTLGICIDEGNWRNEKNPDVRAYKLYGEVRQRVKNRFSKMAGFLPAISIISSSAKDESSFTEQVITEIAKNNDPKAETVYSFSVPDMKSEDAWRGSLKRMGIDDKLYDNIIHMHAKKFKRRWFKVAYGIKNVDPKILKGWYDKDGKPIESEHEPAPIGCKTTLVPEDYIQEYERNCVSAMQNLSGISSGGSGRLFGSLVDIYACIDIGKLAGVANPCSVSVISLSEEDDREIWDYLDHKIFAVRSSGSVMPKRHPNSLRFAHIDLATRTKAGISICHPVGENQVEYINKTTGAAFSDWRVVVEYDFILTITAGKAKPISFEKILKFFIWLITRCNFKFGLITADQFQSTMHLQMLENRGIKTGNLSLDRSKAPYYAWRSGFEERRILLYEQLELVTEAEKLIDTPQKIDHPDENTSKDTCDSAAGAYFSALNAGIPPESIDPVVYADKANMGDLAAHLQPIEEAPVTIDVNLSRRTSRVHRG